jgi:hypothetical protein
MENTKTRVRINLTTREIAWEGTEEFVEKQQSVINEFISKIKAEPSKHEVIQNTQPHSQLPTVKVNVAQPKQNGSSQSLEVPDSFGEFYMNFQRSAKIVDKILIAAYFVQSKSDDGSFGHREAADLLDEQNVNVTNAGPFIKSLQNAGKIYKQGSKFKVHENGIEHLKQLLIVQ